MKKSTNSNRSLDVISRQVTAMQRWSKVQNLRNLVFIIDMAHQIAEERNVERFNSKFFSNYSIKEESNIPFYIILPENKLKSVFDLLVAVLYFYFAFVIPFRIGFYSEEENKILISHEIFFDSILFLEIISNFFCAYYENSILVINLKEIRKRYFMNHFVLDLLAVFPFYLIHANLYWLKASRVLRITLLLKWVETSTLTKNFINDTLLKDQYTKDLVFKLLNFVQLVLITCHCIACFWYYITTLGISNAKDTWLLGADYGTTDLYVRALYWTAVTFSSVGYGDITPKNNAEYIYAMFIEFIGIMFFAYLMGNVSTYLTNFQLKEEAANERENELNKWLLMLDGFRHDKTMPPGLIEKIREYFNGCWSKDNSYLCSSEFMQKLPYSIKEELKEFLFSDVVKKFSTFFEGMSKHLTYSLASIMKHKWVKNFETVINAGKKAQNLYFINSGSIMVGKSDIGYVTKLLSGSYFGEYSIFNKPYVFDYTAEVESSVLYFSMSEFKTWIRKCEFNYYSFALIAFKRQIYFEKEFAKMYNTEINIFVDEENGNQEVFCEELTQDEEEQFNEILENIKEPEPTGCTPEEKEELIAIIEQQAKEIEKLQKLYEMDIKKIITAVEMMGKGQDQIAYELLTEI